jgi:hypothetical protein
MNEEFHERRKNTVSKAELREVIDEVFDARRIKIEEIKATIGDAFEEHMKGDSHQYIKLLMQKEQRKQELWEKTKAHVAGWGSVALIIFFANLFWMDFLSVVSRLSGHK